MFELRRIRCNITNLAFKNRLNEFIYLFTLSSVVVAILSIFLTTNIVRLYIFLIILSAILSITSIRASNCIIFSVLTKDLCMGINNLSEYHSYDYYEDRKNISELFKKEFIEGIMKLSNKHYAKKMKMTTHKWVYKNILSDKAVLALYEVTVVPYGNIKII